MRFWFCILSVLVLVSPNVRGQGLPVRSWTDDMPKHTFTLGAGPSISSENLIISQESLNVANKLPAGANLTFRYDWSYFGAYDVSLGTGVTYRYSRGAKRFEGDFSNIEGGKTTEAMHYVGANVINTKIWFGRRFIWDVCIHMGYMGGASRMQRGGERLRIRQNGFAAGVSTGVDCLITAWLGIGVHLNFMAGVLRHDYTDITLKYEDRNRNYALGDLRVGLIYCF